MIKKIVSSLAVLLIAVLNHDPSSVFGKSYSERCLVPTPSLFLRPDKDKEGKAPFINSSYLKVTWSKEGDVSQRRHYDFRLYRGIKPLGPYLIFRQYTNQHEMLIKSDLLSISSAYACTLRQVYTNGSKSREAYLMFKIKH